ncbi:MAG: deoxyribose-phosphate aldolase [Anaerolineales bacterium]|nr:MAG: deoxyribose-phosphate aldolase [Anaerolineales bacterium]
MKSIDRNPDIGNLAKMIDHPLLDPDLSDDELLEGLDLSIRYDVASACVRPCDTIPARRRLEGTDVKVCVVVGFPHGSHTCQTKLFETKQAMDSGADEIDIVMNIGKWKSGDLAYVERELRSVIEEVTSRSGITKIILENHYLTPIEIRAACKVCERVGADFVATSTGFAPSGVQLEDVKIIRASISPEIGVKVAGGVHTLDQLLVYRQAGVTRVGTLATEKILDQALDRLST